MHNWDLPLLLILTVLQPTLSEHSSIDGGRCCIHSLRLSLAEERLYPHGQYRLGKLPPDNSRLNERRDIQPNDHRNEARELRPQTSSYINIQRVIQHNVILDERNRNIDGKKHYNGRTIEAPLYTRFARTAREEDYRGNTKFDYSSPKTSRAPALEKFKGHTASHEITRTKNLDALRININSGILRHLQNLARHNNQRISGNTEGKRRKRDLNALTEGTHIRGHDDSNIYDRDNRNALYSGDTNAHRTRSLQNVIRQENVKNNEKRTRIHGYQIKNVKINSVRYFTDKAEDRSSSLSRDTRKDNLRIMGAQIPRIREKRHTNGVNELTNIDKSKGFLRSKIWHMTSFSEPTGRQDNMRNIIDRKEANYLELRNEFGDIRNAEKYSRDEIRSKSSLVRNYDRKTADSVVVRNREERNANKRNDGSNIRNNKKYSRDTASDMTSYLEHDTNERNEALYFRNSLRHSRDNTRDRTSSLERTDRQVSDRRIVLVGETRNGIMRNDNTDVRNFGRYSRDNTRDRTSYLHRAIRQKRDTNERNGPIDFRYNERYSIDNTRDMTLFLDHTIRHENSRRISDSENNRFRKVRKESSDIKNSDRYSRDTAIDRTSYLEHAEHQRDIKERNEAKYFRNSDRYLRDDTRERTSISERSQLQENARTRNREVLQEPTNIRNSERYSRDNIRNGMPSSKKTIRQEYSKRITNQQVVRNHEERNVYKKADATDIRVSEKYASDTASDRTSFSERAIRYRDTNERNEPIYSRKSERYSRDLTSSLENTRGQERFNNIRYSEQSRNRELRSEFTDVESSRRYSKDNIRDKILPLKHANLLEHTRRITERDVTRNNNERSRNIRSDSTDIRNSNKYSKDTASDRASYLEHAIRQQRDTNVRNEPSDFKYTERYSRYNTRDWTESLKRTMRLENSRRITNGQETRFREVHNEFNFARYSRGNSRDRTASRQTRQDRMTIRHEDSRNNKNEDNRIHELRNTEIRNFGRYSRDDSSDTMPSLKQSIRREYTRRITDRVIVRNQENRNADTRTDGTDIGISEKYSRDIATDRTSYSERAIRQHDSDERNELIYLSNSKRYSRDDTRDRTASLERTKRQESARRTRYSDVIRNREVRNNPIDIRNFGRYSRDNIRDRTSSLERTKGQDYAGGITYSEETRNREVRNKPIDMRIFEQYSRNNIHDRTLSIKHSIRQEYARRITDRDVIHNRVNLNANERRDAIYVRDDGKYMDNTRERTSLVRTIRDEYSRRITDGKDTRLREEQKESIVIINSGRYSRDKTRNRASSLKNTNRQEYTRRITNREVVLNRERRNSIKRIYTIEIRNTDNYLRDTSARRVSYLERGIRQRDTQVRNEPVDFRHFERFSRDNNRERTSKGIERITRHENIRNREEIRNHKIQNDEIDIIYFERYSKDNTRDRTSYLENRARKVTSRRTVDMREPHNREERARGRTLSMKPNVLGDNILLNKDLNTDISRRQRDHQRATRTHTSRPINMSLISNPETSINASPTYYWQYVFYALQGMYIFGVFMQEKAKITSMDWITSSRLMTMN